MSIRIKRLLLIYLPAVVAGVICSVICTRYAEIERGYKAYGMETVMWLVIPLLYYQCHSLLNDIKCLSRRIERRSETEGE